MSTNDFIILDNGIKYSEGQNRYTAEVRSTIEWCLSNGFPPLPVAPKQDPVKYPKRDKNGHIEFEKDGVTPKPVFTGKNPSYLCQKGVPHLVQHSKYQSNQPTSKEIAEWFANPANGVGTLGGWNEAIWIDIDAKQFDSLEVCDAAVDALVKEFGIYQETFNERTHSGGWRFGVKVKDRPTFTNFTLSPGGSHVGEALGEGRFTVLAPTIGPSGNPYQSIRRVVLQEVETLESIGIYPFSAKKKDKTGKTYERPVQQLGLYVPDAIALEDLLTKSSADILKGNSSTEDRSGALTTLAHEAFGWENWCHQNGVAIRDSAISLLSYSAQQMGVDEDKFERILKTIDEASCEPAAMHGGGEKSCWLKILGKNRKAYQANCPEHIKTEIDNKPTLPKETAKVVIAMLQDEDDFQETDEEIIEELAIAVLEKAPSDIPLPYPPQSVIGKKIKEPLQKQGCTEEEIAQVKVITYDYGDSKKVLRYEAPCANSPSGRAKTFLINRLDETGKTVWTKGSYTWDAYRVEEAVEAALNKPEDVIPVILCHPEENSVEAGRKASLTGISAQGGTISEKEWVCILNNIKFRMGDRQFIFAYCGSKRPEKLIKASERCEVETLIIDLKAIYPALQEDGDLADILDGEAKMNGQQLAEELFKEIKRVRQKQVEMAQKIATQGGTLDGEELLITFQQKAFKALYGDKPWISADGNLYCWVGDHYKWIPDSVERPRVTKFCNSYVEYAKKGDEVHATCPYTSPHHTAQLIQWAKDSVEKEPSVLNPPGINCINGVVSLTWDNGKPVWTLEPHDPSKHFYTYPPLIEYDPAADTTDCDHLLQCLDENQQQVLLRNLAASIDLPEVRKRRGREVKILLACGLGSNGKDALRQTVSTIFGHSGMTSVSLADFAHYDDGRKFALAPLLYSRVNWASENPQTARLDRIQSLKLFATGNMLHSERKGKDHIEFIPKAIGIFNLNEVPSLQGTIQAIQDRIAVLEFRKTFVKNPDPDNPNEIQADPRFAYDEDFIRSKVAPAFLNRMLDALAALMEEGIDYSCTTDSFKSMQKENNHLFQFCEDIGLGYLANGEMTAKSLWSYLEQWYTQTGTLTTEDGRRVWVDQVRPSDKNIKGMNQVIPRIMALFPKAKKATKYCNIAKKSVPIISGIGISTTRPSLEETRPSADPVADPITLTNQDFRPTRPSFGQIQEILENNQRDINNSINNSGSRVEITKTGSGSPEPSHSKDNCPGNWVGSAPAIVNTGSGVLNNEEDNQFFKEVIVNSGSGNVNNDEKSEKTGSGSSKTEKTGSGVLQTEDTDVTYVSLASYCQEVLGYDDPIEEKREMVKELLKGKSKAELSKVKEYLSQAEVEQVRSLLKR